MAEYIEREKVVELFNKWADGYSCIEVPTKYAIAGVRVIPAADVRPVVRGKWEQVDDYRYPWGCTNCHNTFSGRHNFCPNCGARMEES